MTTTSPNTNPNPASPAILVEGLSVVRQNTTILDGVTCRLERGRYHALLGPNGCGKTTFARCLTGQMFPTAGRITVLGETLGETHIPRLRQRIGLVNPTTDTGGFHVPGAVVDADLSATEAVITGYFGTIGLYQPYTCAQRDRARELLALVGLRHRLDHRFATLSTGEQRRALIARALVNRPELLIFDEPTAGLDLAGREQVLATIDRVMQQPDPPAVLMITHHVEELSPKTHTVLLMRQGRFTAQGPPEQILTPERLSDAFGCKVFVERVHGRYWLKVLPEAWLDLIRPE